MLGSASSERAILINRRCPCERFTPSSSTRVW
jgi:hypothetical protein